MAKLGQLNTLAIREILEREVILDGGDLGPIPLPIRYLPDGADVAQEIEVFVYLDSRDLITATTETPKVMVGGFAYLKVASLNAAVGAFLDWGLPKDLLLPWGEQNRRVRLSDTVLVAVTIDEKTRRIIASEKLNRYIKDQATHLHEGQEVDLLIANKTDLGHRAIVNNTHWGLLYENEVIDIPARGSQCKGYIQKVRQDGKLDLTLQAPGHAKVATGSESILAALAQSNGFLAVSDQSSPELIRGLFGMSKKTFKRALGALYKERRIVLENDGIRLKQ